MADGYGFGGEGDWKTSVLLRTLKAMAAGRPGGTSFMEDYTYHLAPGAGTILGAHMLEVCPSIAAGQPDAARSTRWASAAGRTRSGWSSTPTPGPAVVVGLADMGDRFRLVANEIDVVAAGRAAAEAAGGPRGLAAAPDLRPRAEAWLTAGGPHHTVLSSRGRPRRSSSDLADMTGTELLVIDATHDPARVRQGAPLEPGLLPAGGRPVARPPRRVRTGCVRGPGASGVRVLGQGAGRPVRPPVMADVARLAGVSHQTVSRVLNGRTSIRPETRQRVLEAIRPARLPPQHGRPRPGHPALGVDRRHQLRDRAVRAVERPCGHRAGGPRAPATSSARSTWRGDPSRAVGRRRPPARPVASRGSSWSSPTTRPSRSCARRRHASRTSSSRPTCRAPPPRSASTRCAGARLATRHLLDLGHRGRPHHRPARLGGGHGRASTAGGRSGRPAGAADPSRCAGDWSAAIRLHAGQRIAQRDDVTAVFSANDSGPRAAAGPGTSPAGRVPGDLSVVGFDDIPEAAYLLPPLTTVRQDFAAVGRRAIDVLHAAISGEREDLPRLVEPRLVVRSSTGPVRG